jgi:hypothetical protein
LIDFNLGIISYRDHFEVSYQRQLKVTKRLVSE